jgi:hypothetical protein
MKKEEKLTIDEYDALEFIRRSARTDRFNACVGRNAKKLAGLKLISYGRNGAVALTDKGEEKLFLRRCIETLRAVSSDPLAPVDDDVVHFLSRKSHIAPRAEGGFTLTDKGSASLDDISREV